MNIHHLFLSGLMLHCTNNAQAQTDIWQNTHLQLQLSEINGACHIQSGGSTTYKDLNLPWPCQFHRDKQGHIRQIKQGKQVYLLIEASRALPESQDCETHLRALRVQGKRWQISEFQDKVASCPPFQWDAMVFRALFK